MPLQKSRVDKITKILEKISGIKDHEERDTLYKKLVKQLTLREISFIASFGDRPDLFMEDAAHEFVETYCNVLSTLGLPMDTMQKDLPDGLLAGLESISEDTIQFSTALAKLSKKIKEIL